jgi:hypothetical protein
LAVKWFDRQPEVNLQEMMWARFAGLLWQGKERPQAGNKSACGALPAELLGSHSSWNVMLMHQHTAGPVLNCSPS